MNWCVLFRRDKSLILESESGVIGTVRECSNDELGKADWASVHAPLEWRGAEPEVLDHQDHWRRDIAQSRQMERERLALEQQPKPKRKPTEMHLMVGHFGTDQRWRK